MLPQHKQQPTTVNINNGYFPIRYIKQSALVYYILLTVFNIKQFTYTIRHISAHSLHLKTAEDTDIVPAYALSFPKQNEDIRRTRKPNCLFDIFDVDDRHT